MLETKLEMPWYKRAHSNARTRLGMYGITIMGLCLGVIYLGESDRIRQDIKAHTRINASGVTKDSTGLTINGTRVPYATVQEGESLMLSLSDFTRKDKPFNVQFSKDNLHQAQEVFFGFQDGDTRYTQHLDFRTSADDEMKELSFGGSATLNNIRIRYKDGREYSINFR